ncbi:cytochrome c oxidase subunit II [Alteriqipengyuania flavescens]|uniref:cytochrome c oxidase subunit II n=1 Tax=Alteriqipengyuania flavescens TaxID=3053610 RepID=UPI0025B337CC|nr:cytochrome c oxidase subunit II [Alteriqipengyuania flavescens]WJY17890.1 cytochrome c oxidase subunit II [Alteriqipengyuania flavescens]WJY23831.1 cytochrome c oxidase subunit II [Alteriqipengyuania flavescens]
MAFAKLATTVRAAAFALALAAVPGAVAAQDEPVQTQVEEPAGATEQAGDAAAESDAAATDAAAPLIDARSTINGEPAIKGQPVSAEEDLVGSMSFQPQHNAIGEQAIFMHDYILLPIIVAICLFVLGLLLFVVVKYRRRAGREPSKTSHNTLVEVIWTLVPALILVGIAIPSISLLANQYETPPEDAITIKATGYQWYWGYTYVDNGGFEVISNMLDADEAEARGEPHQLAVDNRLVVPVGVPIRMQIIGADVIHSFAVPSLWFKMDAVPGRLNEKMLTIDEPGIYYGQCMELCGARHAYMPIAVEAVPMDQFRAWVASKGGTFGDEETVAEEGAQSAEDAAEAGDTEAAEEAVEAEASAATAAE